MIHHLIDSHCHLDDDRFDPDREQAIARARSVGIDQFVIPATTASRWPKVKQVTEEFRGAYAGYGLHPMFMQAHQKTHLAALDNWLDKTPAIAVGECGLDFYQDDDDRDDQLELFRGQLHIAKNHGLPVIIHARKALDLILREIRRSGIEKGVIHSFSGSLQQAQHLVDLGFKLGIAAIVGYERAHKLQQVVSRIDLSALLIETDVPDQSGPLHKGQRNEPAYLLDHLKEIARLREMDPAACAEALSSNCRQLFKLPDRS